MSNNFEGKLDRLEEISAMIKGGEITLTEAVQIFEEGMKLAQSLENELSSVEKKVEILISNSDSGEDHFASFEEDQAE